MVKTNKAKKPKNKGKKNGSMSVLETFKATKTPRKNKIYLSKEPRELKKDPQLIFD